MHFSVRLSSTRSLRTALHPPFTAATIASPSLSSTSVLISFPPFTRINVATPTASHHPLSPCPQPGHAANRPRICSSPSNLSRSRTGQAHRISPRPGLLISHTSRPTPTPCPRLSQQLFSSSSAGAASTSTSTSMTANKHRLAIIGSGNWGSAIARIAGENMLRYPELFEEEVKMYVYEEMIDGKKLTEIINEKHENVKYLPGIKLPENIVAVPSAVEAASGADLLIFVLPHQFIPAVCQELKGKVSRNARAISMIKGVEVKDGNIRIFADVIEEILGCKCSALSGANIANEVAEGKFSETTIGYREGDQESADIFWKVFDTPLFKVGMVEDVAGVSLCGALKNVVAIAAGFTDGLGWGSNAKAAVMRIGLMEMKHFSEEFFEGVKAETFTETSAGIADLITTCFGGRNRKCAEAFVKTGKSFDQLEKELLNGQKLQGSETAREVHHFLQARGKVDDYPLFKAVYNIAFEGGIPKELASKL